MSTPVQMSRLHCAPCKTDTLHVGGKCVHCRNQSVKAAAPKVKSFFRRGKEIKYT